MNNARLTEIDIRAGVAPPTTTVSLMTAGTAPLGAGAELMGESDPGDDPGEDGGAELDGAAVDDVTLRDGA